MIDLSKALISLYPTSGWTLNGDSYDKLVWLSENTPKPTEIELVAECEKLQTAWDIKQYQRDRAPEYPPIGDQLDALWKGGEDATEMLAKVQAVKAKYPKPE